jgi:hypothetical protein
MKYKFLSGCLALALGGTASSQTADFYVNDGVVNCPPQVPPQIDATNFVNNNFFSINFTSFTENGQNYQTANTRNFTNNGLMIGNSGYQFDTGPTGAGQRRMAANFVNRGLISVGSGANPNAFFNFFFGFGFGFGGNFFPKLLISATNVVNPGTNVVGVDGLFRLNGKTVDLNRATITMEGFEDTINFVSTVGLFNRYWGASTNVMNPAGLFQFGNFTPRTPTHLVNTPGLFGGFFQVLFLPAATAYVREVFTGPPAFTNRIVQAVFLYNTNSAISNNVYFPSLGQIDVEWIAVRTNPVTGSTITNYLYLFDDFGTFATNLLVQTIPSLTFSPRNYTFFRGGPLALGTPAPSGLPAGMFNNSTVTNDFAALGAVFAPTTQVPGNLPGSTITNLPGRIEITADTVLNLSRTRITGLNYMNLKATNHFAGSGGAQISVPLSDISLATTNGQLAITNLLAATVPRFTGEVDLWSGRWTNDAGGFSSRYQVLFVDSRLSPTAPSLVQDLSLRSTNVVINDIMNVTRNFLVETERLTVATNQAPAPTPSGEINLLSSLITWSSSLPRLQYLANNGAIRTLNAVFFGGSRTTPFFTSNFNEPYIAFVNRGTVTTEGSLIWADYFENRGLFTSGSGFGSLTLQSQTALLTNGFFLASGGDISITSGVLTNINHVLQTGRKLTLNVTDVLTDGVTNGTTLTTLTNANSWTVGNGVDLPVKPKTGDLRGTTILDTAPPGAEISHLWAAEDRDCSPAGFTDNVALGRLILDGGNDSLFRFTPAAFALTFDDAATQFIPPSGSPVRSGFYKPANYAPARQMLTNGVPANTRPLLLPPFGTSLAVFRGTNSLNGVWRLFIDDRTTNNLGHQIDWSWKVGVAVLSSNYTYTTNFISINGIPISTNSTESTSYVGTYPAFAGQSIVLPAGAPPAWEAVAQPYPSTNSVPLVLRNNQAVTNVFAVTNQIGPNVFVTNRTDRVYTTDHVTNVVVTLSTPTVAYPANLDVLLVGPHGEKVMLMAGAGALDIANRNALYVDYLEFRNFTTNIDFSGNLAGVQIDPNMKIYFAQAVMNGVSVAERLSGANGGGFCWVSDYAGIYSSTNLFYGGATNMLNTALVQSLNLDSDCDGLVNGNDPEPLFLVTTASLPEATNNTAYSAPLQAGGGPPSPHTWALAPGSAGLANGLNLSPDGVVSGTPTQSGFFAFTVRASVTTPCGILTADRSLSINVSPGVLALSVVIVSQPSAGALVSWPGIPNSTNYLYFKPSPQASDWLLLTNFGVGGAVPARVSVFDPMAANATRFYRVQVSTQH